MVLPRPTSSACSWVSSKHSAGESAGFHASVAHRQNLVSERAVGYREHHKPAEIHAVRQHFWG